MAKSAPPAISRPPETFNYEGKFILTKGQEVEIQSKSYYKDSKGVKHRTGIQGTFIFICAVAQGILVRKRDEVTPIFVYLSEPRKLELTESVLAPHILKLPKKKKKK